MKNKRITRLGLIIFGLALMFFLGAFMARYYNNEIKSISYNDLVKLQKSEDIQLIDVRNIKEYNIKFKKRERNRNQKGRKLQFL